MPQGHVLQRRHHRRAHQPRQAGEVLGEDRVALMRHGRGALLARIEGLFGLQHLGALQVADLDRQALHRRGDHGQGREEGRVTVARDGLGGVGFDLKAHGLGHVRLHARIDVGEGAHRAGDGADGDLLARGDQPAAVPGELGVVAGELEAEGDRLGVDAVAAPDRGRELVLDSPALQGGQHQIHVLDQKIGGPRQLDAEAGVQHVGRGHALVQEARFGAHHLGHVGQEGDDVVLGGALDLVDAIDVPDRVLALGPDRLGGGLRDDAQLAPSRRRRGPRSRTRFDSGSGPTRCLRPRRGRSGRSWGVDEPGPQSCQDSRPRPGQAPAGPRSWIAPAARPARKSRLPI